MKRVDLESYFIRFVHSFYLYDVYAVGEAACFDNSRLVAGSSLDAQNALAGVESYSSTVRYARDMKRFTLPDDGNRRSDLLD